ncbi:hypothetical protein HZH68_008444 [Vespula germanica]|uniref:Uncharacterized protein n=1 Tax=Vespula germanica TaxID=30212 RepID=A0A834JZC4_VESGE|nr:hypothetical protein HZH68_008444 [Vespula germanica]
MTQGYNNGPKSGSRWNVEIYIEEQGNGEEYAEEEEEEEDRVSSQIFAATSRRKVISDIFRYTTTCIFLKNECGPENQTEWL